MEKRNRNKKNIVLKLLLMFFIFINFLSLNVLADVGDFETYSSGDYGGYSSYTSTDYSSDYSSDYSDSWSSTRDYSSSSTMTKEDKKIVWKVSGICALIVLGAFAIERFFINGKSDIYKYNYDHDMKYVPIVNTEEEIISKIKELDSNFDEGKFLSYVRDLFVKLQYAWADRDWEIVRCFETPALYEQHSSQLQRYIKNKQINKLEGVSVNSVRFSDFTQTSDKDIVTVIVNSKMIDYIIDENTNEIIRGDKNTYRFSNYRLTFVRTKGMKTELEEENKVKTVDCPNCGASVEVTIAGRCSYCRSIVVTSKHDWVLSNLEKVQ